MRFEDAEAAYYDKFLDGLEYQNEKHLKARKKKRCKTIEEYRKSEKTAPESAEYYLGDKYEHESPEVLFQVVSEFLFWRSKRFPNVRILDLAGHTEEGAPHMVGRQVWVAHDEAGNLIVSQEKALEEMGVERFDEAKYQADMAEAAKIKDDKKRANKISYINRYNNRKMSYTAECREKMIEIAKSHGVEIITEPRKPGKNSISQAQHIAEDTKRLAEEAEALRLEIPALRASREQERAGLDKLLNAHTEAVELLQGDMTAIQAVQGVTALMDALGASARPLVAERVRVPAEVTPGPVSQGVYDELKRRVAAMDSKPGLISVEGPTM